MAQGKYIYEDLDPESQRIVSESYRSQFGKNNIKCEGFLVNRSFKKFAEALRKMEVRDDDIWLCGFPKSGTTWSQEMVWCLANGQNHEDVQKTLSERFPILELCCLAENLPEFTVVECAKNSIAWIKNLPSPRFIKTHLPFNLLPEKLQNFSTNAKIIHVMRNPRDTAISYYEYCRLFFGFKASFLQCMELFFKGLEFFGPLPAHLKSFLAHQGNPKILFLKYEEMKKDLNSVIHITANFIGKNIRENEVEKLLDHLSFTRMKENPAVNSASLLEIHRKMNPVHETEGHFMRRGIVGDWKEKLSAELCEKFEKWEKETMSGINFTFSL